MTGNPTATRSPWSAVAALAIRVVTHPTRLDPGVATGASDVHLRADEGHVLAGWRFEPEHATVSATVVLAHGYSECRRQLLPLVPALRARRRRVLMFDFRAHGRSGGKVSSLGPKESSDVAALLAYARSFGGPVEYVGTSMGAAAYLLGTSRADRAVLDAPYPTLREAVSQRLEQVHAPRGLVDAIVARGADVAGLPLTDASPLRALATLTQPTLVVFSADDEHYDAQVRARFERAVAPPAAFAVAGRGSHAAHFDGAWIAAVTSFLATD